jgi:hypothetical protein
MLLPLPLLLPQQHLSAHALLLLPLLPPTAAEHQQQHSAAGHATNP